MCVRLDLGLRKFAGHRPLLQEENFLGGIKIQKSKKTIKNKKVSKSA